MKCRDCGGRLLGIQEAQGRCDYCERALEVAVKVALPPIRVVSQSIKEDVVSQPPDSVVSQDRRKRWVVNHPDQRRAIHREGQRRRRG